MNILPLQSNYTVKHNQNASQPSQPTSFKGNDGEHKNTAKKTLAITLTCLGAAGAAAFLIIKKRKAVNPKTVIQNAVEETVKSVKYPEWLVAAEAPFNSSIYSFMKRSPKGFYLEKGQEINTFLRTGKLKEPPVITDDMPDYLKKLVEEKIIETKELNRAIIDSVDVIKSKMTSKTTAPMTVYRDAPASWLETAENGILRDKAFCSTSTEAGASMEGIIGSNAHKNVRYEIRLPENTPFWDLTNTTEKEMLLPANSKFKIVGENILELIL